MLTLLECLQFCLIGAMLAIMLLALCYSIAMPAIDRWSKRFFITFFSVLTICLCTYFIDTIIYFQPDLAWAEYDLVFFESLFTSVLFPMPTILILHYCGEKVIDCKLFRAVLFIWGIFISLLIFGHFTNCFYIVAEDNQFIRSEWYPLGLLPLTAVMVLNIIGLIRRRDKLSKRYFVTFMINSVPMAIVVTIHAFVPVYVSLLLAITICALTMYSIIISDQVVQHFRQQREIAEKEREIAHQRASVMVLQMRPHFIYNTMMSIYYLCKQDSDKAQRVTLDFTTYLRKNFTAIAGENTVPFKDELEHARAYLAVEQAQHEDMLCVDYDTPHISFNVPPLTLQPLVENAVKHSLDPDGEPLHIYVKTRLTDDGDEIIVENNGADFSPAEDSEPHIALSNIEQRLKMMCAGKMTITAREGGGTIVKVIIPGK